MSTTISWRLNRLRAMGPAELCWRAAQAVADRCERWGLVFGSDLPARAPTAVSSWVSPHPTRVQSALYTQAANRVLHGHWDVLALHDLPLGFPPDWNRDPKTGVTSPLIWGRRIDYRDERVVGDIRYLWELNRHSELVTLAQAWHLTREARYADGARRLLTSWLEQCPPRLGPNWTSSLEVAMRLSNWAFAWHLLGGEAAPLFAGETGRLLRRNWLVAVYQHCRFVSRRLSRYSSANNHLLGELTGWFLACVTWPLWPESARWRERARRELEAEAQKQNHADGTNREQAFWYHHAVADMLLLCLLVGRTNGIEFSRSFCKRLESMLGFIEAVMDVGGHVPMIGDSDDAVTVRFSREPGFSPYRSLLATGAVLFARSDFKAQARTFDDKSRWLLGDEAASVFDALPPATQEASSIAFPEGGYYVLGLDLGTPREARAVVDTGPFGYLSIAAHAHADALALTLSVNGTEVLIDPGTYVYHAQEAWRRYFRGTGAHNTVRVDRQDQSVNAGNFLWLRQAEARCVRWETTPAQDRLIGEHHGYSRLPDPVIHRREVRLLKSERKLLVTDTLTCRGAHAIEQFWHFSESCPVHLSQDRTVAVAHSAASVRLVPDSRLALEIKTGDTDAPAGWISRRYDERVPTSTLVCSTRIQGTTQFTTEISWS